jgi:hypothetical protein
MLVSESHFAVVAPASLAAFSMRVWHIPQLPQTFTVSVFKADFVCAFTVKDVVAIAITKKILSVFILIKI